MARKSTHINTKRKNLIKLIVVSVLSAFFIFFAIFTELRNKYHFKDENIKKIEVSSEFFESQDVNYYNDICVLKEDITISSIRTLGSSKTPYIGEFDGNFHTITIDTKENFDSLFGYVGENAIIKNVTIVIEEFNCTSEIGAILAIHNKGLIENCKIECAKYNITNSGIYSLVAAINYGTISKTFIKTCLNNKTPENSKNIVFGVLAAFNYGDIKCNLTKISYTGFQEVVKENLDSSNSINKTIGAVFGIYKSGDIKDIEVIIDNMFLTSDRKIVSLNDYYSFEITNGFIQNMGFEPRYWVIKDNELSLKRGA